MPLGGIRHSLCPGAEMSSFLPKPARSSFASCGAAPVGQLASRARRTRYGARCSAFAFILSLAGAPSVVLAAQGKHATHVEVRPLAEARGAEVVVSFTAEPDFT